MSLHPREREVGVRELHDRLSEYLERVESGVEVVVTRRGRRIARLVAVDRQDPVDELIRRGVVQPPERRRRRRRARVRARGTVSDLISEQRR